MTEDMLWNRFAESGKIEDYLQYSAKKETEDDNIGRNSDKGASCGRTG